MVKNMSKKNLTSTFHQVKVKAEFKIKKFEHTSGAI